MSESTEKLAPLALVVDDAHWSDAASVRFLAYLQPRLEELPVAMLLAARSPAGSVLADLTGDCPAVLGLPDPPRESPGLSAWLAAGPETPADALRRLEVPAAAGVALLPRGDPSRRPGPGRGAQCVSAGA